MKLYLSVIGMAMLIVSIVNILFDVAVWYYVVAAVVFSTAAQFAFDGIIAFIINKLPNKWFGVDNPMYNVTKTEQKFYKKIKVRKWKDNVWELGGMGGFSKKSIVSPDSPEYVQQFIVECNKGVLTHRIGYLAGYLSMLFFKNVCAFTIAIPISTVNFFLNILPTIVLRYNTPKLKVMLTRLNKKSSSEHQKINR